LLKHNAQPVAIDVGDAPAIDAAVHEFRLALSNPDREDVKAIAATLSAKVLRPLRAHFKGFHRLLVSPDGAMNLLPVAALLDAQGEYLAQSFEITYLTSGRDLLRSNSKTTSRSRAVIVADPEFGNRALQVAQVEPPSQSRRSAEMDRSGLVFQPLVNTAMEAQDLKKLLKLDSSSVFLQQDATESNLKLLHGPRILHIASHGFFLSDQELNSELNTRSALARSAPPTPENPLLRSGIALAGANARHSGVNDDGILTALETAQLDLQGTELVVLSACDSGVGDVQNGEGVYGLRRALVLAGAQTQITSLWKVSDAATRLLMVDYYRRLLKGEGRSAALRRAQQSMLADPKLSHPYFWASFVPIGSWAPLPAIH
jgi:CHAT domain-containing protein